MNYLEKPNQYTEDYEIFHNNNKSFDLILRLTLRGQFMTYRELKEALDELEELGVDLDVAANLATHEGVKKVRKLFTNSQGHLFMETRR